MASALLIIVPLLAGYILDLIFGDPRWLPHPIRLFGKMISFGEKTLNKGNQRFIKGAFLTILYSSLIFTSLWFLIKISIPYPWFYYPLASILIFYSIANKSLIQECQEVIKELNYGIEKGRKRLSWIVGRDTSELNENQIKTAVLETLSENLSDGVIAPLFYYALFGVPGILTYKMINTFDSMVGYKNEKYEQFGKFAAILDDVVNYIPARLTAIIMATSTMSKRSFQFIIQFGRRHSSPNAGYPEAALAGILNCRFGGPNLYHGKLVQKPYIGLQQRNISANDLRISYRINHVTTLISIIIICCSYLAYFSR